MTGKITSSFRSAFATDERKRADTRIDHKFATIDDGIRNAMLPEAWHTSAANAIGKTLYPMRQIL